MSHLRPDIRYAWRVLTKKPGFAMTAVAILAIAIGLNSAVFSVIQSLVLRPLPVSDPESLIRIYSSEPGDFMSHSPLAPADVDDLRDQVSGLDDLVAYFYTSLALEHRGESRLVMGALVSGDYFTALGVEPDRGRGFCAADRPDTAGAELVAVLSHAAWQRRFGGDPGVVGRRLRLNGHTFTIIGVAPQRFSGLTRGISPELWLPLGTLSTLRPAGPSGPPSAAERRQGRSLWVLGRLAPGVTSAGLEAELESFAARLRREFPETHGDRELIAVAADKVRILPGVDGTLQAASLAVMGVLALVLLIASANLASLLLAKAVGRRHEIAIRLALGARRSVLIRQLLTESLLLAGLGGACGLWIAAGSNAALGALQLPVPVHLVLGLAVDGPVFLFTLAVSTLTALAFGLAPALEASRTDLAILLRTGAAVAGGSRHGLRGLLTIAQVAISLILLICAGLAVRSLRNAGHIDPGFDPRNVVVATVAPQLQGNDRTRTDDFYQRLVTAARALPGVESAALASHLPLSMEIHFDSVAADEQREMPEDEWPRVDSARVGPGYFAALRIPLAHGRELSDRDRAEAPRVAIVNETLAERLWPGATAVGKRLRVAGVESPVEIVGVARDGKYRTLGEPQQPFLYLAIDQDRWRRSGHAGEISTASETLVVRVRSDTGAASTAIRQLARELDEKVAIARLTTLEEALAPALWLPRMAAGLFSVFGVLGLILAATGIYGLISYSVSRRAREIGVRMALGARRRDVSALMVRDGLRLTAIGLAVGLAGATAVSRALESWLYGIPAIDFPTFVGVPLLLILVAAFASLLPARRASRTDPMTVLRAE
ncbi:MAG: ABC transporter permease [Thermoanaerobaculia bacterium]